MKITQELVERIAHLARLTLSEDEKMRMSAQLEDILGSMTALDKLTLEEEPEQQERVNVLRPDRAADSMDRAALLDNAPRTDGEYILVPGAMGRGGQG